MSSASLPLRASLKEALALPAETIQAITRAMMIAEAIIATNIISSISFAFGQYCKDTFFIRFLLDYSYFCKYYH